MCTYLICTYVVTLGTACESKLEDGEYRVPPIQVSFAECPGGSTPNVPSAEAWHEAFLSQNDRVLAGRQGPMNDIVFDNVSGGDGFRLSLYAFDAEEKPDTGLPSYRGLTPSFRLNVDDDGVFTSDDAIEMLMVPVTAPGCTKNEMATQRTFHQSTLLDDGRVLITGGGRLSGGGTSGQIFEATRSAEIYDPKSGVFTPVGDMFSPRLMHTATKLDDGRVLIVGGAGSVQINSAGTASEPFPILPMDVRAVVEVFNPETGSFAQVQDDDAGPRVFHSSIKMRDGSVLITGGIGSTSPGDALTNPILESTVCTGAGANLGCSSSDTTGMYRSVKARVGHASFLAPNGDVILWGGVLDTAEVPNVCGSSAAPWYSNERLRLSAGSTTFESFPVSGMSQSKNVFLASTTAYRDERFISVGGLVRNESGIWSLSTVSGIASDGTPRQGGSVFVFDMVSSGGENVSSCSVTQTGDYGALSSADQSVSGSPVWRTPTPIWGASTVAAHTWWGAMIFGGFQDLELTPVKNISFFREPDWNCGQEPFSVVGINYGSADNPGLLEMRVARGGHHVVGTLDGTYAISGGYNPNGGALSDGEIIADFIDPDDRYPRIPSCGP